jgi:hypothetical protein
MTHPARSWRIPSPALLPVTTVALAAGTFIANLMTPVIPVGVLYVAVVLLTARFCSARGIMMVGASCATLAVLADIFSALGETKVEGINTLIRVVVIGLTTSVAAERKRAIDALQVSEEQWRLTLLRRMAPTGSLYLPERPLLTSLRAMTTS